MSTFLIIAFIWVIGWMVTVGFIHSKVTKIEESNLNTDEYAEFVNYKKNKTNVIVAFFFIWPVIAGMFITK